MNTNYCLTKHEVHLWKIRVNDFKIHLDYLQNLLTEDENKRAQKFRFKKDYNCYIVARGCLRILLSRYCKKKPNTIQFHYSDNNKPFVKQYPHIKFNVSHSGGVIIIGFTKDYEIGVDVEKLNLNLNHEEIATSFFSAEEINELTKLSIANRPQGFFNCWTRKEAFIKAEGSGLSFPLDQFVVSLDKENHAELLATKWDLNEKSKWFLKPFSPYKNYIGAIAIKGEINHVQWYDFKEKHQSLFP